MTAQDAQQTVEDQYPVRVGSVELDVISYGWDHKKYEPAPAGTTAYFEANRADFGEAWEREEKVYVALHRTPEGKGVKGPTFIGFLRLPVAKALLPLLRGEGEGGVPQLHMQCTIEAQYPRLPGQKPYSRPTPPGRATAVLRCRSSAARDATLSALDAARKGVFAPDYDVATAWRSRMTLRSGAGDSGGDRDSSDGHGWDDSSGDLKRSSDESRSGGEQ